MASTDDSSELELKPLHIIEWSHLDLWKYYPLAMGTSLTVRCALYPTTVVKTRLQLQNKSSVYRGTFDAFRQIAKTEGVGALYRGFWITFPQVCASFLYNSVYEKFRDVMNRHTFIESPQLLSALAGGAANACTEVVFVPTDIVSQYMQIHNQGKDFTGGGKNGSAIQNCLRNDGLEKRMTLGFRVVRAIYKTDGLLGFYRGFWSSLAMFVPSTMVFWWSYYEALIRLKSLRARWLSDGKEKELENLPWQDQKLLGLQAGAGLVAGVVSAGVTNPLEVYRVRIQIHRGTYLDTFKRIIKEEGFNVFTKGLLPRVVHRGIFTCLIMIGYEAVKRISVLPEYKDTVVW
ncbi:unnamed protein product [Bursaphelenchus okinawaensis]|uniref:Mitochondrial carrier protein n=1 Tax=Bursaphelenchus okinawaensis TaxID=465554 RepID=A0A811KG93_9BILA|nr:unnamed protein product [Bursaphelenchus okinawaensis]CAG9102622.1 unnamed protein product [Bursaphelenchus okinawaensis]